MCQRTSSNVNVLVTKCSPDWTTRDGLSLLRWHEGAFRIDWFITFLSRGHVPKHKLHQITPNHTRNPSSAYLSCLVGCTNTYSRYANILAPSNNADRKSPLQEPIGTSWVYTRFMFSCREVVAVGIAATCAAVFLQLFPIAIPGWIDWDKSRQGMLD